MVLCHINLTNPGSESSETSQTMSNTASRSIIIIISRRGLTLRKSLLVTILEQQAVCSLDSHPKRLTVFPYNHKTNKRLHPFYLCVACMLIPPNQGEAGLVFLSELSHLCLETASRNDTVSKLWSPGKRNQTSRQIPWVALARLHVFLWFSSLLCCIELTLQFNW